MLDSCFINSFHRASISDVMNRLHVVLSSRALPCQLDLKSILKCNCTVHSKQRNCRGIAWIDSTTALHCTREFDCTGLKDSDADLIHLTVVTYESRRYSSENPICQILLPRRLPLRSELGDRLCRFHPRSNAVRHPDAVISIAGDRK